MNKDASVYCHSRTDVPLLFLYQLCVCSEAADTHLAVDYDKCHD